MGLAFRPAGCRRYESCNRSLRDQTIVEQDIATEETDG